MAESKYCDVLGSKMHYLEEGSGDPILFLHGNPTSSYLWRTIIPHLSSHGRCIAPDLIGMGKSDKPDCDYRFFDHVRYVNAFIEELDLKNVTLVIHDWGSALGFMYAMEHEANVKGIAFMEAIIAPVRSWQDFPSKARLMFRLFRTPVIGWLLLGTFNFFIEKVMPMSIIRTMTDEEMEPYKAPFRRIKDRVPLWRWPSEIPIEGKPEETHQAIETYNDWLQKSELPKLLLYAHPGALIRKKSVDWCRSHLKNLKTVDVGKGIHYIQEDEPDAIGKAIAEWIQSVSISQPPPSAL